LPTVAQHYGRSGLLDTITDGLRALDKDLDNLTPADLAPIDEFHIRGREATLELAALAGIERGCHALDVGAGLGGSSRFLATEFHCQVKGVDLTPEYCDVATSLSDLVGLSARTEFHCASALETPFEGDSFDLAWTQHVQMNIEDKPALYREIVRVLRPGGRFVFHDILAGPGGPPHLPVPWASEAGQSFLIAPEDLRALLESVGFAVHAWVDTTKASHDWFLAGIEQRKKDGAPPLGIHLLMGDTAKAKIENVARNLNDDRITVFQAVCEKP
jgi:ubiquinone/menaquinone biosynthesis C-methylase UbiE